jgi:hypothetical protein
MTLFWELQEEAAVAGPEALARLYLSAATEHVSATGRDKPEGRDAARRILAEAGTGHALLALASRLPADPAGEQLLARETEAVRGEISRADGKCGVLTALTGTAAVVAASQLPHGPALAQAAVGMAAAALLAATVLTLWALRPRYGRHGWCRWSLMTADAIRAAADADDADQAATLAGLSRIARAKYDNIRAAISLTVAGLAVLVIGLVAGVVA